MLSLAPYGTASGTYLEGSLLGTAFGSVKAAVPRQASCNIQRNGSHSFVSPNDDGNDARRHQPHPGKLYRSRRKSKHINYVCSHYICGPTSLDEG